MPYADTNSRNRDGKMAMVQAKNGQVIEMERNETFRVDGRGV